MDTTTLRAAGDGTTTRTASASDTTTRSASASDTTTMHGVGLLSCSASRVVVSS